MVLHNSTPKSDEKRAFRVKDASSLYGLSRSTLYVLMSSGRLRTVKIGGRRLIPRDALEALLDEGSEGKDNPETGPNRRGRI